jgi:hypothetical protein
VPSSQQNSENRVIHRAEDDDEGSLGVDLEDLDLQALAEQVYDLLKRELRLERERQGSRRIW